MELVACVRYFSMLHARLLDQLSGGLFQGALDEGEAAFGLLAQ
jgi:hypothetical protein